jgi:hypothetical protein
MSDELRVVFRFLPGPATVSQDVLGRKLSGQIKEELFHETHNAVLCRLFLSLMGWLRRELLGADGRPGSRSNAIADPRKFPLETIRRPRPSTEQGHLNNFRFKGRYARWEEDVMSTSKKPLKPDDFPVNAEGKKIKKQDGTSVANSEDPAVATDVTERLNEDEARREEDKWSA